MKSGVNIDCNYMVKVRTVMKIMSLPYPRLKRPTCKQLYDEDGTPIPLIKIDCPEVTI